MAEQHLRVHASTVNRLDHGPLCPDWNVTEFANLARDFALEVRYMNKVDSYGITPITAFELNSIVSVAACEKINSGIKKLLPLASELSSVHCNVLYMYAYSMKVTQPCVLVGSSCIGKTHFCRLYKGAFDLDWFVGLPEGGAKGMWYLNDDLRIKVHEYRVKAMYLFGYIFKVPILGYLAEQDVRHLWTLHSTMLNSIPQVILMTASTDLIAQRFKLREGREMLKLDVVSTYSHIFIQNGYKTVPVIFDTHDALLDVITKQCAPVALRIKHAKRKASLAEYIRFRSDGTSYAVRVSADVTAQNQLQSPKP